MRINHNISALNAWKNLTHTDNLMSKSLEKLSSGFRINKAADDAAGLAISEKMRAQISGLNTAKRNAQDAISLIQTAEGALSETQSILQRMRELAVQSASDNLTDADRAQLDKEFTELKSELTRIADTTEFNTKKLLDGSASDGAAAVATDAEGDGSVVTASVGGTVNFSDTYTVSYEADGIVITSITVTDSSGNVVATASGDTATYDNVTFTGVLTAAGTHTTTVEVTEGLQTAGTDNSLTFQIGSNAGQTTTLAIDNMNATSLGLGSIDINSLANAKVAIYTVDKSLDKVSSQRAMLGAKQNRLEHTIANLGAASENLTAAESRIRDVDMALEMAEFTRHQILLQSGTAMLAQANSKPQAVLQLLS